MRQLLRRRRLRCYLIGICSIAIALPLLALLFYFALRNFWASIGNLGSAAQVEAGRRRAVDAAPLRDRQNGPFAEKPDSGQPGSGLSGALDWLIGEMGPLQYWITPEDLLARKFENTVLTIEAY